MKRRDLLSVAVHILFAVLIGISGAGCLITAFDLDARVGRLLLCCLAWAAIVVVSLRWRWGWAVLLGADALWLVYLWRRGIVQQSLSLLAIIARLFDRAYGWGVPDFMAALPADDVTLAMEAVIGLCTMAAGISLARRRTAGAVLAALIPLFPCLVVTDAPPDGTFFFLTLLCIALALLSQSTRRADPRQGSRLLALLLIPVLLANLLLFRANPQQAYERPEQSQLFDQITILLNKLPFLELDPQENAQIGGATVQQSSVDLTTMGPTARNNNIAMWVQSSYTGTVYLRSRHYANYNGATWTAASGPEADLHILTPGFANMDEMQTLRVTTLQPLEAMYLGYYPVDYSDTNNGMKANADKLRAYAYDVYQLHWDWKMKWRSYYDDIITVESLQAETTGKELYLQLPQYTAQAAVPLVERAGVLQTDDVITAADKIALFVQNSARYDLNTQRMPRTETDFALWFLNESDTGYCIHFATAAAVLLRAAGIPARYVEGYSARVQEGDSNVVRERHAHAWVEYFVPKLGWVILEATPAAFREEPPQPTQPPTTPPQTTAPTQPSQGTMPPATTVPPSSATAPTGTTVPPTTVPSGPGEPDQNEPDLSGLWKGLKIMALSLAGIALMLGQWQLRLWLRRKALQRGAANRQALRRWRFARYLAKLRRQEAPEALHELAKKAKFSQHTLTQEELGQFDGYFARSIAHLRQRPWPLRLVYRLIFAAY